MTPAKRPGRRDRIRAHLADLKLPGALEALDPILSGVDGGRVTAAEAIREAPRRPDRPAQQPQAPGRHARLAAAGRDDPGRLRLQLVNRRYETGSTILTSNQSFEEWGRIFGDEVMATALIDRLLHHCHIVNIRGNSYRMRQHADLFNTLRSNPSNKETETST